MELSHAPWCLVCDGPCREPMRFTLVLARDRMIDLTEETAVGEPDVPPAGRRRRS